jgi:transposase
MKSARRRSRLETGVQEALIVHFVGGVPARTAAELVGINRNSAILFYHKLREVIAARLELETPYLGGHVEVDESYFGGRRKGKRGRGAAGKVPVFGLLKRGGKVHAVMIPNAKSLTLMGIIREHVQPDSIVFTDGYYSYNSLDVSEFHHVRIDHKKELAAPDGRHINGIENFWNQAKRHLRRYNGIPRHHFYLYIKECEWRFNYRPVSKLLQCLRAWTKAE